MNLRPLALFLVTIGITAGAHANVLIYAGTVSHIDTSATTVKSTRKCFVAIDPTANKLLLLRYGNVSGMKQHDTGDVYDIITVPSPRADGKIDESFAFAHPVESQGSTFGYEAVFFHGTEKTIVVSRNGNTNIAAEHPRSLTGTYRITVAFFTSRYQEDNFAVGYDQARSVVANVAQKTIAAVRTDLIALLESRGFSL